MASERRIELLFTLSRRSVLVWVDIERMESVVYNLLSNALKFTPNGGRIEVILSLREEEESVTLTVRDTGIGIPKDKQGMIFERFAQASRAVDSNMKGSGIGLSLCRDIVTLHHGEISVDSRPGEGASFTVKLKLGNAISAWSQIDFSGAGARERANAATTIWSATSRLPTASAAWTLHRRRMHRKSSWSRITANCASSCTTV